MVPRKGRLVNLKTYQAYSVNEVLQQIRNDLGEDAAIIHTRTFKRGGILGLFAKTVIEVTVADTNTVNNNPNNIPQVKSKNIHQTKTRKLPPAKDSVSLTRKAYSITGKNIVTHKQNTQSHVPENVNNNIKNVNKTNLTDNQQTAIATINNNYYNKNNNNLRTKTPQNQITDSKQIENPLNPKLLDLCQLISKNTGTPNPTKPAKPDNPVARRFILTTNHKSDMHNLKQVKSPEISRQSVNAKLLNDVDKNPNGTRENPLTSTNSTTPTTSSRIIKNIDNYKSVSNTEQNNNQSSLPTSESTQNHNQNNANNSFSPISEEISIVKQMVAQVLQKQAGTYQPAMPKELSKLYMTLIENEIAQDLADEICGKVRDELNTNQFNDPLQVKSQILKHLKEYIPEAKDPTTIIKTDDGRPLTLALIGPTGVGKTTTIAKLAATFKLKHNKRVGLITTDTYRIAAVDQLRTYANIIGIPLKVSLTPEEIAAACHSFRNFDVILIDTAGRSPNDKTKIDEIQKFLQAAKPHETHLVLASTYSENMMLKTADKFASVQPDRIIFTKLDEAVSFGVLVNVIRRIGTQISFITTGQEVPDHIEPGSSDRLAKLAIGDTDNLENK